MLRLSGFELYSRWVPLNVLLLYLLDRHIQLQITSIARRLFRCENTFHFNCWKEGWGWGVDVVVLSNFWDTLIFRDW